MTQRGVLQAAFAAAFLFFPALGLPSGAQPAPGRLIFAPVGAVVGVPVTARGTNLAPGTRFALVWHSARAHWNVGDGKFNGILAPEATQTLATGTSDAQGTLLLHFTVPEDFGYIHDVELQPDGGTVAAHQGFTIIPHLTVSPASGPLGTPITITMTGDGYRFYQLNWHLMYDGAQTGWLSAITTHGTARVTIPATGAIGMHTLQALEGPTAPYLNEQQSPNYQPLIPTVIGGSFRVVPGAPHLPGPVKRQTLPREHLPAMTAGAATPSFAADFRSGVVGSTIVLSGHGFTPRTPIAIGWETVVGDDISGNGFALQQRPLTSATSDDTGAFSVRVKTPDDLGGDHRIIALERGQATTAAVVVTYTITPSVSEISPAHLLQPGEEITIHVKGASWTETGNIYTVDVDDAYFGYACGFFSQGDVTMSIRAPGGSGWHYIDLYPAIYNGKILGPGLPPQGSDVNGSYFLLPMLNVIDHPAERMPAFHFAIRVR